MKYTFERITFLMIFAIISIGSISCDPQPPVKTKPTTPAQRSGRTATLPTDKTPVKTKLTTPAQRWANWVDLQERIGRTVVDAAESRLWLSEHSSKISLPDKIGFMEQHLVMESPFIGIIITTDHIGKRRIVARQWPLPLPPSPGQSFKDIYAETHTLLSHTESLNWLRKNGYNVSKVDDGYRIIRQSSNVYIDHSIMGNGTIIRDVHDSSGNPRTLIYDGNLCIVIPK